MDKDHKEDDNKEQSKDVCEWTEEGNDEEDDRITLGLIGKLWSDRILNVNAFITTIKNVWVTQHGVDINVIGKNLFQIQFYHWRDKDKIFKGQPWYFDRIALLLTDMVAAQKPFDLQFYALPIWIRIYNAPFRGRYNENNARILGEKLGDYMEMDRTESLGMEKSLRIRVSIDVRKALKKHITLKMHGGDLCIFKLNMKSFPFYVFIAEDWVMEQTNARMLLGIIHRSSNMVRG